MKKILLLFVLLTHSFTYSQEKFGDVKKKDLKEEISEEEKNAGAVVLYKGRETYFDYDEKIGWYLITEYYERLKITDQKGLEVATKKIDVYLDGNKKEEVIKIKGNTYNLVDGKFERESLKKKWIFEDRITENRMQYKFTMPQVTVGSIIEWEYRVISPFWKIDDLVLQQDIPVRHYYAKIRVPSLFHYSMLRKGYFNIQPREEIETRRMHIRWKEKDAFGRSFNHSSNGTLTVNELVSEFEMRDIPALQSEPYVDNIENYRYSVVYELESMTLPNKLPRRYSSTWDEVAKAIFKVESFGGQLEDAEFLREEALRIKGSANSLRDRMDLAFELIKNHYTWNGKTSKYAEQDLEKSFKVGTGNVADINLSLILLLRECGLRADPILLSTRSHGKPMYPTIDGFNYVIAGVRFGKKIVLLDATEKWSAPDLLPERAYNWVGRMVEETGSSREVELFSDNLSREDVIVNYDINEDGSIEGDYRSRSTLLAALDFRTKFADINSYSKILVKRYGLDEISELDVRNLKEVDQPVDETFSFVRKNAFDKVGDAIYFSPMNFLSIDKSPFLEEVRKYPVYFMYPFERSYSFNIAVPDGYEITSMPESGMVTFGQYGEFKYLISEANGKIILRVTFSMKKPVIPQNQYLELQKFFEQRVEKENEKVVLQKTAL